MNMIQCDNCQEEIKGEAISHEWDRDVYVSDLGEKAVLQVKEFCSEECKQEWISHQS